jgi:hypothetical protein
MEALVVTWREVLVVVIAVLAVYVAELVLLLRWSGRWSGTGAKRVARSGTDARAIDGLTREVGELRKQVARLQSEVDKLRTAPAGAGVSPYNLAIQMARQGASANDVASGCGISRGEAELIVALYRKLRI